jgi:hypothetical protein
MIGGMPVQVAKFLGENPRPIAEFAHTSARWGVFGPMRSSEQWLVGLLVHGAGKQARERRVAAEELNRDLAKSSKLKCEMDHIPVHETFNVSKAKSSYRNVIKPFPCH